MSFDFAPPSTPNRGTEAYSGILTDTAKDTSDKLNFVPITFGKVQLTFNNLLITSIWNSSQGNVVVTCSTAKTDTGLAFTFTITNGLTHRLNSIDLRLPEITTAADPFLRIASPYRGGSTVPWSNDWTKGQGNSSVWPGTAFSPIVTPWNDRTKDTLAISFFNRSLMPVMLYWFSGSGAGNTQCLNPVLRALPALGPGETATFSAEYRIMKGGPAAHAAYYRQNVLAPFMKELGIPEANSPLQGPGSIAMTATGADNVLANVAAAHKAGASAYIQWAAPDGAADFYNPYPAQFPWFDSLGKVQGLPVGCLINPSISPRFPSDNAAFRNGHQWSNVHVNLAADDVRLALARLRDHLVQRGVTIAFWDCGGSPDACSGHEWLKVLSSWKQAGIAIMPESSCDVAAWTTGLWMEYPYSWNDYTLPKIVTPNAALAAHTNTVDVRGGIDWKDDAKAKGVRPIVDVAELGGGK
jgi:hypothetical protein